jgi:hypothetical protein
LDGSLKANLAATRRRFAERAREHVLIRHCPTMRPFGPFPRGTREFPIAHRPL